jgi:hypothetical protein
MDVMASTFTPPQMSVKLVFTEPEYSGLFIRAQMVSIGTYLSFQELSEEAESKTDRARHMMTVFGGMLIEWNLVDPHGNPIPANTEGLLTLPPVFVMRIIDAWREATSGVSTDLGKDSGSGETSPEQSLPMDVE